MASDNAGFVDTENTKARPPDADTIEGAVAARQIAEPSAGEISNDAPATAPPLPATETAPAKGPEDAGKEDARQVPTEKRNGVALNGSAANGKAVHEASRNESSEATKKGAMEKGDGDACERSGGGGGAGDGGDKASPAYAPGEERRMLRNAVGVGVVFMVHFTATLGVTHLQSSVNKERGLGTSALAAQYAGLVISSLALSVFLISKLGCKWTMVVAIACNVPYMAAQMYPRVYTLVPAAFLMGLAVAPLWSAKCTYLCVVAEARAALTGRPLAQVRDQIIGVFFMVFLLSMVWGNLVSSVVLSYGERDPRNASLSGQCGVAFCPNSEAANDNPNLERPPQERIVLIIGIYVGFMLLAALVAGCFVDSLKRYSEGARASSATGLSTRGLLMATLQLHRRKEMLLMVPLSLWLGVDYAFVEAEYTASFVACAWGIHNIGYVIISYGAANSALALVTGWIVARAGRRAVMCTAAVLHLALMASTLAWRPSADQSVLFFVVAVLWGAADGHWAVQINSLYAILFPHMEEAAYSNFRLWQSVGFVVAFSYSHYLCTVYKLYIVMALLLVGVAGYLGIEYTRPPKARLMDG